jgi:gamma-glutamyl hydrolase
MRKTRKSQLHKKRKKRMKTTKNNTKKQSKPGKDTSFLMASPDVSVSTKRQNNIITRLSNRLNGTVKQKTVTIGVITAPYLSQADSYITSYMAASYVKWLEAAGALIVPLQFDLPKPILQGFLKQLNGVVLIGGGIDVIATHSHKQFIVFEETLNYILNYVTYQNSIGHFYPIWCTCMSFELVAIFKTLNKILPRQERIDNHLIREGKVGEDTLQWTNSPSELKQLFTKNEIQEMNKKPAVFYAHGLSLKYDSKFTKKFSKIANIVCTGISENKGIKYIAAYEFKDIPIFGVQFHPEKPPFEYVNDGLRVPKSKIAINLSSRFARFFINKCKRNTNIWIGGKHFFDFTINDYNVFNKAISRRLVKLHKSNIDTAQVGDAGVYFFGSTVIPINSNILTNPWELIKDADDQVINSNESDNP